MTAALDGWALVLGASSGLGAASARALARAGMDVFGVHLDRRATLPEAEAVEADIRAAGRRAAFFNVNAADERRRAEVLDSVTTRVAEEGGELRLLLHSLAFGSLATIVRAPGSDEPPLTPRQLGMTCDVMAHSLVWWVRDLVDRGLLGQGGQALAFTSAGASRALPRYGAVAAAKAALESHARQLAFELAPRGIRVNCLRAGVTDTPALRRFPGHEVLLEEARRRHPAGRLTQAEDVAAAVVALADPGTAWITGNVIAVDGGESIAG